MNRIITTALIAALIVSSMTAILLTSATSMPSVPEFTVKYIDYSYDTPATYGTDTYTGQTIVTNPSNHVDNRTVQIVIKNQPFTAYTNENGREINLFYNVRYKGSFGENWTMMFGEQAQMLGGTNPYLTYGYATQDPTSSDTTVILTLPWNIVSGQMDFQVKALIGYTNRSLAQGGIMYARWTYDFYGQESGWSSTQTITIGRGEVATSQPTTQLTPTPSQIDSNATAKPTATQQEPSTQPASGLQVSWEQVIIVVMAGVIAALAAALVLTRRKKQ
jgi:hypothetical protein